MSIESRRNFLSAPFRVLKTAGPISEVEEKAPRTDWFTALLHSSMGRRTFFAAAAEGAVGGILLSWALPETARAEPIGQEALFRRSPFPYYPNGRGVERILIKFAQGYVQESGEPWSEVEPRINRFIAVLQQMTGSGQGICNGMSNWKAQQLKETPSEGWLGGVHFTMDEIDTIAGVWHYGHAAQPEQFGGVYFPPGISVGNSMGRDHPNNIFNMLWEYVGMQRIPVVIERSSIAGEIWTHPIDKFWGNIQRLGGGWARLTLTMDGPNYRENTLVRLPITVSYEINEDNPAERGRQSSGPKTRFIWRPGVGHYYRGYQIEDNVFSRPMLNNGLRKLVGYSEEEWQQITPQSNLIPVDW